VAAERLEAQGIKTADQLFKGLYDSGLSGKIASHLYIHEKAHADSDEEGRGEFGFAISSGWVVAYYLVEGERTPEQLMKIASAPGFSEMSSQDWDVYNVAWKDFMSKLNEEKYKKMNAGTQLQEMLVGRLSEKLDQLSLNGDFPNIESLLNWDFKDLIIEHGDLLYEAYEEAVTEMRSLLSPQNIVNSNL
jgi:hypothetical protein